MGERWILDWFKPLTLPCTWISLFLRGIIVDKDDDKDSKPKWEVIEYPKLKQKEKYRNKTPYQTGKVKQFKWELRKGR